jgi:lipoprotein signal peptidase
MLNNFFAIFINNNTGPNHAAFSLFRGMSPMKKLISVALSLIIILGVVFSAPASLFLYSAKAQSISHLPFFFVL